jgi:hypothetical protein
MGRVRIVAVNGHDLASVEREVSTIPQVGDTIDVNDIRMVVRGVIASAPRGTVDAVIYATLPLEQLRRWRTGLALVVPLVLHLSEGRTVGLTVA